jgi:hypothetical protein
MSVDSDIGSGSDRSPSYNIGGAPPYGWTGTPGYNPFQAPSEKETFGEVALYERMDRTGGVTADAAQKELQNPPFIGVGSTSARVPGHMANSSNPAIPHRILRGYMRRFDTNPASTDNASDPSKSYKARLFFMWNPQFIERTYAALEDIQQFLNLTNQANGPVNNEDTQPYLKTEVGFSLVFDRQEEVNRFPNHPGCLVDLAVFDLLSRGGSPAGQMTKEALKALDDAGGTVAGGPSSKSLIFNPGIKIAVIFSPYIVYFGNIIDVRATFEKFSHRMTPTRMTLDLKMRLYAFGSLNQLKASDQAAVSSSASAAAYQAGPLGAVDPTTVTAKSQDEKDRLNIQGARDAMSWGEHWIGKVNYEAGATRCANAGADSYDKPDSNIPLAFD